MTKRMLIDAVHPEETRVVVLNNNQIDEFDFESSTKSPLRGNIYLAKVTRVEPSLQAAFVEYGGNRHGFLAFNEIHPDYYQIPVSDREELLREQAAEDRENAASQDADTDTDTDGGEENSETSDGIEDVGGDAHEEASTPLNRRALYRKYKIQEVIKRRQIILIQVLKEERGNK
ncbi:MAG TPA: ribonuclease E/G, partial [Rhodobiaceae bacterium]|nr:ribonuclease E/G [Rhodobiaceae bacterium]